MTERLFCTLCGRELRRDEQGHYLCVSCGIDHIAQVGVGGAVRLARVYPVHRTLDGRTHFALLFTDSDNG